MLLQAGADPYLSGGIIGENAIDHHRRRKNKELHALLKRAGDARSG